MLRLCLIPIVLMSSAQPMTASPLAEVLCDTTSKMRDKLKTQFGNRQQAVGIRSPEEVMEVWTGPRGDWTLVMTYSDGRSCIVAMGEHWQQTSQDPA